MDNKVEFYIRDRKTKLFSEYEFINKKEFNLNDTLIPDTLGESKVTRITGMQNLIHEFLIQWTERWSNFLRTELPLKLSWSRYDSTLIEDFKDTGNKDISFNNSSGFINSLNPGFLIDLRIKREYVRELKIQYFIGLSLTNGTFMDFGTYERTWQNKFDISMKMGRNFNLRILLNLNYLFNKRKLKYDLAELKASALF
jgi:hypothetical protein